MIMTLADKVCPEIKEAIELLNLTIDDSDSYFLRLKSKKNTIMILLCEDGEYTIEINDLPMQTEVPLELINEIIIISLS